MGWVCECFENIKVFQGALRKEKFWIAKSSIHFFLDLIIMQDNELRSQLKHLLQSDLFEGSNNRFYLEEKHDFIMLYSFWKNQWQFSGTALVWIVNLNYWSSSNLFKVINEYILLLLSEVDTYWWLGVVFELKKVSNDPDDHQLEVFRLEKILNNLIKHFEHGRWSIWIKDLVESREICSTHQMLKIVKNLDFESPAKIKFWRTEFWLPLVMSSSLTL